MSRDSAMPRRVLFVASLHHPEELLADISRTPAGSPPPLFPLSMIQHAWERAMRQAGYTPRSSGVICRVMARVISAD